MVCNDINGQNHFAPQINQQIKQEDIGLGRATFFLAQVGFGLPILSPGRVRATNFDIF